MKKFICNQCQGTGKHLENFTQGNLLITCTKCLGSLVSDTIPEYLFNSISLLDKENITNPILLTIPDPNEFEKPINYFKIKSPHEIKHGDGIISYLRAIKFEDKNNEYDYDYGSYLLIFEIKGYYHSIGSHGNDKYCINYEQYLYNIFPYINNYEKFSRILLNSLSEYDSYDLQSLWKCLVKDIMYYGKHGVRKGKIGELYYNDNLIYRTRYDNNSLFLLSKLEDVKNKLHEIPALDFRYDKFFKNVKGYKIYYDNQPAIISKYLGSDDLRIVVVPDKKFIPFFGKPVWLKSDENRNRTYYEEEYKDEIITSLLDKNIDWFRDN